MNKLLFLINFILIGGIWGLGYINQSSFEMISAICAALFWIAQIWLLFYLEKDEKLQKKRYKSIGVFLLLPTVGMIINGIMFFKRPFINKPLVTMYFVITLSVVLFTSLQYQMIILWKNKVLAGRFFKLVSVAASFVPLSLFVVLTLKVMQSNEAEVRMLSCLTVVTFGSISLLIAVNMVIVSICGYKTTIDSIRIIYKLIKNNKLKFIRLSIAKDFLLSLGKLIISVISLSFFMFVNVLYNAGMGIARAVAVKMHVQDKEEQVRSYRLVGIILSISSICYVLYSVRLFFGGKTGVYDMNVALVIASYTFVEFGINIREAIRLRKSNDLETKALRAISLSSTLICFVLTQTAIISFAAVGDSSIANALSGIFFGGLATIVGLYIIFDSVTQGELIIK